MCLKRFLAGFVSPREKKNPCSSQSDALSICVEICAPFFSSNPFPIKDASAFVVVALKVVGTVFGTNRGGPDEFQQLWAVGCVRQGFCGGDRVDATASVAC
jgi:hypothetical protein